MLYFSHWPPASPPAGREQAGIVLINMYFVYVLKSKKDYKLYYGLTDNLKRRIREHNNGEVSSTKSRVPFELVYFENTRNIKEARQREKYFKSGFGRKYIKNKLALSSNG
ncbi:MAG TPA: GIY-YIG nuclease family protein [Candidatus Paceibacterota bacterium]|nr:GIY-YIG nuclease family protein [Candidatus Paceibacterota bacterium]